jgi:hypothetical protein
MNVAKSHLLLPNYDGVRNEHGSGDYNRYDGTCAHHQPDEHHGIGSVPLGPKTLVHH